MKVEVERITEQGTIYTEDIEVSSWQMDSADVKFIDKISLWCEFKKIRDEILVLARVRANRQVQCSRCLEDAKQDVKQEFSFSYDKKKLGRFLEVDDNIREEMLLEWPMKPLCRDDCKGICPGCGKNLNIEKCICKK